jgi:multidrug efflux pump subunit AcrB
MLNLASRARPYFGAVVLTAALLTAGGIYSATRMPSGVYPEVTFARVAVVARVPSLSVANMDIQVTQPLEQAVRSVIGVARVRSKTIRGGSELSVDFSPGTDMKRAENLTWNRIGSVRSQLPPETDLTVEQMTPAVFPIISVVVTGGDSATERRDYAFYTLAPLIKTIPDVYRADVAGGDLREIEVEARPEALLQHGLSAADLADQIAKAHRLQPVGRVEQPPFAFQLMINNQGESARTIEELVVSIKNNEPLRVKDVADVKVLHQDRVMSIGFQNKDAVVISVYRSPGGNTVNISRDLNALLARMKLNDGTPENGNERRLRAEVVYDQAMFVNTAVKNVRDAILIGGAFSILILLAFLRSWRATLISALAIPTTLAITFLFLHWSNETLNLMSLGGLAVAIGLIIDDTVVVIENIARHLSPGARSQESGARGQEPGVRSRAGAANNNQDGRNTSKGVSDNSSPSPDSRAPRPDPVDAASGEITGAVIGSTLTTVLVFVPLAFIVGVYGQFFASLSWALAIAVLVSMVISLTIIPVFAAKFLAGRPMRPPGPIYRFFEHLYELMLSGALWIMEAIFGVALRVGRLLLGRTVGSFVVRAAVLLSLAIPPAIIGFFLFTGIPGIFKGIQTGLMPAMDEGAFVLDYWAPSGTPLAETEKMTKQVEEILLKNPDIDKYVRRTGAELGLFATQTSRGDFQVILRPAEDDPYSLLFKKARPKLEDVEKELKEHGKDYIRSKYRRRSVQEVKDEVEDEVKDVFAEHQFKIETVQIMQDELSDLSGADKPVEVKLFGPDHKELRRLAEDVVGEKLEKLGKGHGIKEVNTNVHEGNPDLEIRPDQVRGNRPGLTVDQIQRQLQAIFLGQVATQVRESALRITDVRVRYPDAERFGRTGFDAQRVLSQWLLMPPPPAPAPGSLSAAHPPDRDRIVLLSAIARVVPVRTPDEQYRENGQPAIFVTAEQNEAEAGIGAIVADIRKWLGDVQMPAGYHWEIGGYYLRQQEAFQSLFLVMVVAVILVFIMLAFQFRSIALPILIYLTQPLSLVSGLFALWLTGTPLNVSSYMGAILLIGLDMKNGIILVEYIQQLRQEGIELREALIVAGRTRFRPILMTSLAAILGLLPLALGAGPGAQMQQPLAVMVIGGLTANMLFTRLVIPVGYLVLERDKGAATAAAPQVLAASAAVSSVPATR